MDHAHAGEHKHPNYLAIAVALLILTTISFFVSEQLHSRALTVLLVMSLATIKATLVAMFFMHAKFEGAWLCVLTIPTIILGTVLVLALFPDVVFLGR